MFVQVIQAKVKDAAVARRELERWKKELAPGAKGWLGATGGVSPDGTFISVVRFESEQAAQANSDRPEQGRWWSEFSNQLEGDAQFDNYTNYHTLLQGGSDEAEFVQVIRGKAKDIQALLGTSAQMEEQLKQNRPDVVGGSVVWREDGDFTQTVYFTSEQAAREGEQKGSADEQDWPRLIEEMRFIDLRDPWLVSP